jgi:hypothetical protein
MKTAKEILPSIRQSLSRWTVVGPVAVPAGGDLWTPLKLDGAMKPPTSVPAFLGESGRRVEVDLPGSTLNFSEVFGLQPARTGAFAFTDFEVPECSTLTLRWDVDYWGLLWLDGREVFALRNGNGGAPGQMRHRVTLALDPGRHCLALRVMAGQGGWNSSLEVEEWCVGVPDLLREDRDARWRDYRQAAVRLEYRPEPDSPCEGGGREKLEAWMAAAGVEARWIGVTHHIHGAYFQSRNLPAWEGAKPEYEEQIREWVRLLHWHRFAAMTWLPLTLWGPAWKAHPDWRVQFLVDPPPDGESWGNNCCLNSPYGNALLRFCVETLKKFDLDGLWFDGAGLHGGAVRQVVGCVCPHCAKRFRAETGRKLPRAYDWNAPDFRHWVQWRYDNFAANWQRLVDGVHAAVPQATVVFNHYHREGVGWNGAIGLNPVGHDYVSGTETDYDTARSGFYTRCMRAYGRGHVENWMGLATRHVNLRGEVENARRVMDFALGCCNAGGHPSMGGYTTLLKGVADEVKMRAPYLNLPTVPYLALHVSQQTETFLFGRNPTFVTSKWHDHYWASAVGWHRLLSDAGFASDVLYDAHLDKAKLSAFPILLMPFATALSEAQWKRILAYVKAGGKLIAGPWFGLCDEWGETRSLPLGNRAWFPFGDRFPDWAQVNERPMHALTARGKSIHRRAAALAALPAGTQSVELMPRAASPIWHRTAVGKGEIVQLAYDVGGLYRELATREAVDGMRGLLASLATPLVELVSDQGMHLGVYRRSRTETIVQLQSFDPGWMAVDPDRERPETRWGVTLRWHGPRPLHARTMLPEPGPDLPLRRIGKAWQITLPPMLWGQVVAITNGTKISAWDRRAPARLYGECTPSACLS